MRFKFASIGRLCGYTGYAGKEGFSVAAAAALLAIKLRHAVCQGVMRLSIAFILLHYHLTQLYVLCRAQGQVYQRCQTQKHEVQSMRLIRHM
jgi:uncharacterized membrane protein (DUF485 family)